MKKKHIFAIIILSVILAWAFDVFIGRQLTARLSTLPLFNRLGILSPQAPIVITNKETVRVSDGTDMVEAASQLKSKISSVVILSTTGVNLAGTALNLSSDGSFVTGAKTFLQKNANYYVVLNDGRQAQITQLVLDPATSLIFFKASLANVSAASFGSSANLAPGEKLLVSESSLTNFSSRVAGAIVSSSQSDFSATVFQSDFPQRSFQVDLPEGLKSGSILANSSAEVEAIFNGETIISADVTKQALNLYFNNPQKISRPSFGFSYSVISAGESRLSGQPEGAKVIEANGLAARNAGLQPGDVITDADNKALSTGPSLEEILEAHKAGDTINLAVVRAKKVITLQLTAGELK